MAEIDFQDILDNMSVSDKPADPIQSIYKIIPQFDSVQISILFQVFYFIEKWGLDDLHDMFMRISELMKDNKSLGFMSEYSRAVTPQIRQAGNRLSGLAETAYASLLA